MADTATRPETTTGASTPSGNGTRGDDVTGELTAWLEKNWDPDLSVGEWWERLGLAGWVAPTWPTDWYGHDLSRAEAVAVQRTIASFGALGAPGGLGLLLAGPTIVTHGSDDQKERYLRSIVTGQEAWAQLFSEPGAGSDLAGLNARAERDGDEYIVNGQKVWTSGGQIADLGMLIARTDLDAPKHTGLSYFAIDMAQDGVDVRPLREITGRSMFNEVFLSDARVPADALIGGSGNGWKVANTTLAYERAGLGAGGGSSAESVALPGTVAGDLDKRVGDFVRDPAQASQRSGGATGSVGMLSKAQQLLVGKARENGAAADPVLRQDLMRMHTLNEIARYTGLRQKALKAKGVDLPGAGNLAKLTMSQMVRMSRDIGLRVLGASGMLHAYSPDQHKTLVDATGDNLAPMITDIALFSPAPSIYGGTDEVQRNIIGERVLGLPKEPGPDKATPFRELPKNG